MAEFAGLNVLVAGAGVTGRSTVDALRTLGARVTVTDGRPEALADFGAIAVPGLSEPPPGTDLIVTSPGWKPTSPLLTTGVEVIGEVELAWRIAQTLDQPPVWLAVTGTDGKTTTVGMLESILLAAGLNAVACGNVGLPVIDAVLAGHQVLAVELSSYQLYWQNSLHADAAVVLNLAEDHIDWHGSMAAYTEAKAKIYTGARTRVFNADDPWSVRLADGGLGFTVAEPGRNHWGVHDGWLVEADGVRLCPVDEVRPPGSHNVSNALAAAALARVYGVHSDAVRAGLTAFRPQPHRVELIGAADGVNFVNDSKATNSHAAQGSLTAYEHIVWIAGGELHGAEVDDLVAAVAGRLRAVVLLGVDQDVFAEALRRHAPDVPVSRVGSGDDDPMTVAVRAARGLARPGDVVLLAPAAKSFDMFTSYVHRGEAFTAAVQDVMAG
ncbi:UDP-N-acetylmuramoyl-L-alanine--D-glutamate ligase [Actinocrispum wychmicini]|uniref:UDP-N-acetylmuramoylalanine--D-glutamate ligase n=1 Tax=Actinocrispum wychmicini TaxID=1213861 RepID=A0A4R2JB26_9PSEU|nr:UDP-N-acetylmuramoyl-L-alanine--D-glutamate ligase [Actinocrispum wychmicini]TCO56671.1 UDP-N-acetylmuramoylalanine--D-glutamate ligase [Actinocrispum wychmicini]